MRYKKILLLIGGIVLCGIAYYGISPLFQNTVVDDALPENLAGEEPQQLMPSGEENLSEEEEVLLEAEMEKANAEGAKVITEEIPDRDTPMVSEFVPIVGTIGHPASGNVRVLPTQEGGSIIRFEDLKTINGPNLHVYLAKDLDATEFIDLGPIRGTEGNINYSVPSDIDISEYKYVMHWCVPFGVLFNYAEVN